MHGIYIFVHTARALKLGSTVLLLSRAGRCPRRCIAYACQYFDQILCTTLVLEFSNATIYPMPLIKCYINIFIYIYIIPPRPWKLRSRFFCFRPPDLFFDDHDLVLTLITFVPGVADIIVFYHELNKSTVDGTHANMRGLTELIVLI